MALRDPLPAEEVQSRLDQLDGWTGDTSLIQKTYTVGYDDAIAMVAQIGKAAIELQHRPDIDIRWDHLRISMTTHTANDRVTDLDFQTATRIDTIATSNPIRE